MVDYKKNFQAIAGSAAVIVGGVAIVLGILGQIYLRTYHPLNESIVSLQQQPDSLQQSPTYSYDPQRNQEYLDAFHRQQEFEELAFEKGGVIGGYLEMAKRRGLVEIVECGDDSLSDFNNTKK